MPIAESDLKVGDRVVYANQGVCRVVGTTTMEIAGTKQDFIKLSREDDQAIVMVPKGRLDKVGLRRVADASELKKVFAYLASPVEGPELDWKVRARSHGERMSEGGLMGLAQVVKSLTTLADLRPLPPKERELYDNARHLLVSEVAAASTLPDGSAEDAVDLALFPPGKERVKPPLALALGEDGEELGLDDGLETTTLEDAALEEEPAAEEVEAAPEEGAEAPEGEEETAEKPRAPKKPAAAKAEKAEKAPKAEAKPKAEKPPKAAKASKPKAEPKPKAEKSAKAPKAAKPKAEPKAKPAAKPKPKKK
ncbi:MAG TPA: CarD family transcriptional regulator [Myxococcales bacterium]|jgi:RNA polymerase-interacting CarD/CdnL/TRCF family regulator